jgi:hypothetical protein
VLEDDDTLATEAASEEDDDGTRSEGRANLGRADGLASLKSLLVLLFIFASILGVVWVRISMCGFANNATNRCFRMLQIAEHSSSSSFMVYIVGNVPSWAQQRRQPGSICWPSGCGAVSTARPWQTSSRWVGPPCRIVCRVVEALSEVDAHARILDSQPSVRLD